MDDTALIPLSKDGFQKFKLSYPNIYEINYEEYQEKLEKLNLPKMTKTQFYLFKWKTPKPFEGPKTFENRMKNLYPATQNLTELYSLYIRIFPQLSNSYEEYRQYMGLMCIKPMDINYFKSYKNYFPEHDENDYPKYQNRLNILGTQNKDTSESNFLLMEEFSMKENEFKTFKSRLPSVHERYKNYELRNQDIGPLCEFEFNDLKYQYSVSYENYIEHEQRMTDSFRKPLSLGVFSEEKSMRVLLGENYSEHFKKITQKYESYIGKLNDSKQIIEHMKYLGIETLDVDNFIEHKLAYPYNYGTFEKFCSLMISHNWKGTPAITEIWFTRMKILRPKLCDKFDDYNNRTRIYGFPEMTEIQFQRTKYEHSTPGESTHDFLQRLNINDKIKPYIKEIHLNFTLLSPRYFENYPAYLDRVRQYEELMDFSEFKCFMEYLPKLGEDLFTFNNRNKPSNFNELNSKSFVALKLYIAINHSDMNVMDSLKVNPDEFMKYKSKFPRQFELYYDAYYDRIIKEGITEIFNKEDFQSFKAANFPLPHEDYNQHRANMKSIGFNSLPKDVFYFFKGLYPNLFATTYLYRSSEIVTQLLNPTNFDDPIYKENMTKPIVKEIIERFDSYQEMENKYENLTLHFMTNNQFEEFTMCFPKLFESYNSYKLSMLETTYFPPIDETYDQYLKRMKQLQNNQYLNAKEFEEFTLYFSFGVVSSDEFHYKLLMKKQLNYREPYLPFVYAYFPMVYENYNMYRERLRHLDHKCLDKEQYNAFVMDFPDTPLFYSAYKHDSECTVYFTLIDKNYKEYEARMAKKSINDILSENDYEEKKKNYFSSIYEKEYDHYVQRIKNLVHRAMLSRDFQNFQSIEFPRVFKQYDEFQMNVLEKGATKVMNEETYILLTNAFFPPIYEDSENYHKRMTILKNHVMSNEEFQEFTINFPLISKSYYAYKSCLQRADRPQKARIGVISFNDGALKIIDETLFNSIKNAYFPKMNETYETYSKRMISIGFNPLAKKQFQDCIDVYPKPSPHFSTYIKNPETTNRTEKSSSIMNYIDTGMKNIGCVPLSYRAFDNFRQTIPRISQSYNDYYKNVIDKGFILMLNKNQSEAVKDVFYPRMTEDYNEYNNRLNILGMNIIKEEDYKLYKQTYPKFFENTYETYLKRFSQESPHLNEEEFNNFLKNSPRLVENYDMYLKRRRKEMLYTNHVIEEHSYQMYYELKYVFMPDQCETLDTYIMKIKSLSLNENRENIMNYYMEIMELYPRFFESYEDYLQRINESMKLIHLKLNETEFHLYFSSYPRPFESYHIYVHRMRDQEYVLTKNQFNNYRKIYSRIPENIESYVARLETLEFSLPSQSTSY
ncbi:uncharacterized protein LOC112681797 [Sipha flava]|uniref:Uncharacterized protein LOC112681797 n=1 Tax=Sipha flava TaxID=143950 RepID=A0A8B8FC48_9HEMI|nr:uncharacterized protein LOC112681797 [Sipha flava]